MDSITQAALGAAIGGAGWYRTHGVRALWVGAAMGTLPDLDVAAALAGDWASLRHHRGVSHSVIFAPLVSIPLGHLWARFFRWRDANRQRESDGKGRGSTLNGRDDLWKSWALLCFWAIFTHPLLDAFTAYGTQLLYPMSSLRVAWDGISIVDPIYTFPLLFALLLCGLFSKRRWIGQVACVFSLLFGCAYLAFGTHRSHQVEDTCLQHLEPRLQVEEVRALPTLGNTIAWRVLVRDVEGSVHISHYSFNGDLWLPFHQVERDDHPLIEVALDDERGETWDWFTMGWSQPYLIEDESGSSVIFRDLRYGGVSSPTASLWGARARFDENDTLVSVERIDERQEMRLQDVLDLMKGELPPAFR